MKTILITIDPHDDLTSIKDKMTWSKSPRMLIFFPNGYALYHGDLMMNLIHRHASSLGSQLAIVTRDGEIRRIAENAGIPCFTSAPLAEKSPWHRKYLRKPRPEINEADNLRKLKETHITEKKSGESSTFEKIAASGLLIIAVLVILYFFLPSAKISIHPKTTFQEITYQVAASPLFTSVDISGKLPAMIVTTEISGTLSAQSTGSISVASTKAVGEVGLTNNSTISVTIPAGTIVQTGDDQPVMFSILQAVTLPENSVEDVTAKIEAVNAGSEGNVTSGKITQIVGFDQQVSVQNVSATTGGKDKIFPAPNEKDFNSLETQLDTQLYKQCKVQLAAAVQSDRLLILESITIETPGNKEEIPTIGEPSDTATLTVDTSCQGITISRVDEEDLARRILDQNQPDGKVAVDNLVTIIRSAADSAEGSDKYTWTVTANRKLIPKWKQEDVVNLIMGKKIATAESILSLMIQQVRPAEIKISPSWWKVIPWLPLRIQVRMESN